VRDGNTVVHRTATRAPGDRAAQSRHRQIDEFTRPVVSGQARLHRGGTGRQTLVMDFRPGARLADPRARSTSTVQARDKTSEAGLVGIPAGPAGKRVVRTTAAPPGRGSADRPGYRVTSTSSAPGLPAGQQPQTGDSWAGPDRQTVSGLADRRHHKGDSPASTRDRHIDELRTG